MKWLNEKFICVETLINYYMYDVSMARRFMYSEDSNKIIYYKNSYVCDW